MTNIVRKIQFEAATSLLDAVSFLSSAHRDILNLFNQYGKTNANKPEISGQICAALMTIMQIEEELFLPAVKKVVKENGSVSAAIMEHSILKYLIAEITSLDMDSSVYEIKINVLGEYVKEHFTAKQTKLFPKVIASQKLDLWTLGSQLALRKQELEFH